MTRPSHLVRFAVAWLAILLPTVAPAAPRDFMMYLPGGAGSAEEAQPYVDSFLRRIESALGWPAGESRGKYVTDAAAAREYLRAHDPGFGLVGLGFFAEHRDVAVVAAVTLAGEPAQRRYHVLVREDGPKTLAALRGRTLVSNQLEEAAFLSRVGFRGKLDLGRHVKAQSTRQPLKGVRAVARGEATATLVDDVQLAHLAELQLGVALRTLISSEPLPPLPLVRFVKSGTAADAAQLTKFLPRMCEDAKGKELCRSLRVTRFATANPKVYEQLR